MLKNTLSSWAAQPPRTHALQRDLVCRMFSSNMQIGKFINLYLSGSYHLSEIIRR